MGDVTTGGSSTKPNSPLVGKTTDMLLKGLQGAYKDGVDVYGKPLYTAPSEATQGAWGAGTDFGQSLLASGGFGTGQKSAMDSLGGVFSGYGGLTANGGLTTGQSEARNGVAGLGSKYADLGTAYDPTSAAYQTIRNGVINDTVTGIGSLGASNGRTGSDIFTHGASEGLGEALAGMDYANETRNVENQYRALDAQRGIFGDTFGMDQTGVGNVVTGLNGQGATAGNLFSMGQQAIGNQNSAIGTMAGVGASQDADALAKRMADADLYDKKNNANWESLARASSILGGTASASGSTTSNTIPWWALLGGGAATAASVIG